MGDLYQLPSVTITAGGNATINLKDLPVARRGRIPHVKRFIYEVDFTPTYTTAPTTAGNNNVVAAADFWDGKVLRFIGGFNHLRAHERINSGMNRFPDPDTNIASASARYLRRVLHLGPPQALGADTDYLMPTGALQSGEIRVTFGALTDVSADTTVLTGTVRCYADLTLLDEVRIPPSYQVTKYSLNAADQQISGRCLLMALYAVKTSAFGAWTAGDIGDISLDLGLGNVIQAIKASVLTSQFLDDFAPGEVGVFQGDQRGATDLNGRVLNHASTTALTTEPNDLQPIYWMKRHGKLTKQEVAETAMRLTWNGTATAMVLMRAAILPQTPTVIAGYAAAAFNAIGRQQGQLSVKTLSKKPYKGPRVEFMPWVAKVA